MPFIVADDGILLLSYFVPSEASADAGETLTGAILRFDLPMHLFGPPNDEAIRGHPLWRRGLESYGTYRVDQSSLLRRLAAMNHVHPRNDPVAFDQFQHYIVTFEDSTFECIARSYEVSIVQLTSVNHVCGRLIEIVRARDEQIQSELRRAPDKPPFKARLRWWANALNPWPR